MPRSVPSSVACCLRTSALRETSQTFDRRLARSSTTISLSFASVAKVLDAARPARASALLAQETAIVSS